MSDFANYPVEIDITSVPDISTFLLWKLPQECGTCSENTIEVERRLTERQVKREITSLIESRQLEVDEALDFSFFASYAIADVKEKCLIQDIQELSRQVDLAFIAKLKSAGLDPNNLPADRLYQVVETPLTFLDLYPGDTGIHYKVFTKREVFIRDEGES